jgi:hypothetical protein
MAIRNRANYRRDSPMLTVNPNEPNSQQPCEDHTSSRNGAQVMKFQTITTRVESDQLRRFDALSRARGQTRAEVVRIALDSYLHMSTAAPANLNRIAQTTEFMQIALDLLVSRDMPDKRDAVITTVAQRMEELHGGRSSSL